MQNERKLTVSIADVQVALELWLNSQVLKTPVVVESIKRRSSKANPPGEFDVTLRSCEEGPEGI